MKQFWVDGVLEKSVHDVAILEVGLQAATDTVEHPWESILELPGEAGHTLPPHQRIAEVFERVGRSLLILGEPGSGKTITLLELTRDLITRAERDPREPVPVVFNLSAWVLEPDRHRDWPRAANTIAGWVTGELAARYFVPKDAGRRWVEHNRLVLLLDGLDEVAPGQRAACVEAINRYVAEFGVPGLAVCSRIAECVGLPVRLRLHGAIRIKPLTPDQVDRYLVAIGPRVAQLRETLRREPTLQSLADTPLMLSVMTLAYQDRSVDVVARESVEAFEVVRARIFETYIDRMFERRGQAVRRYDPARTKRWLTWLARGMISHGQTQFAIEQLQPSWLPSLGQLRLYVLLSRFAWGPVHGLALGLLWWAIAGASGDLIRALVAGAICGTIGGLTYALLDLLEAEGLPADAHRRRVSRWFRAARVVALSTFFATGVLVAGGVTLALVTGFAAGGLVMLATSPNRRRLASSEDIDQAVGEAVVAWLERHGIGAVALLWGLPIALAGGMIGAVLGRIVDHVPAEVVWLRTALLAALLGAMLAIAFTPPDPSLGCLFVVAAPVLALLLLVRLAFIPVLGPVSNVMISGFASGALCGIAMMMLPVLSTPIEGRVRHFALRVCLCASGQIPRDYRAFLDYAASVVLLRRVGRSYIFIHRLLLEHFASVKNWRRV